jgi:hypothetical protein
VLALTLKNNLKKFAYLAEATGFLYELYLRTILIFCNNLVLIENITKYFPFDFI